MKKIFSPTAESLGNTQRINCFSFFFNKFQVNFYFSKTRAFIDFLIDTTGVPLSAFHVSGHSAGAQIAGAVGLGYRERHSNTKLIPRITGLDPGNYIPDLSDLDNYIDATDGAFVDVIHTDQYSGIYQPIGN